MILKVLQWNNNGYYVICCEKPKGNTFFLWKDGTVHHNSTGYLEADFDFDRATGYWSTKKEAEIFLAGWKVLNPAPEYSVGVDKVIAYAYNLGQYEETKMKDVKELTVAEISEALGYEVKVVKESTKPYQFKAGDVCVGNCGTKRIIVKNKSGELISVDKYGGYWSTAQKIFDSNNYKKIGKLADDIK